ncbi:hypothetical protein UFOVP138_59 [uncultured Caudovirales phage]|uniref:Uncharacterized protein n=1 Tax=uncultured Caudovirales phage TaxID=2100421 RepID=A0A6J5LG99_9CAUD|nr:hypothetical protein UFOVP138_59 [uncultured Caudovirales phage]
MLERDLSIKLVAVLNAGLIQRGITAPVRRAFQPRQSGTPNAAFISFYHVSTVNVGYPASSDVYDTVAGMTNVQTQRKESRYTIGGLAPVSKNTDMTAADYVGIAASILQNKAAIALFAVDNIGVQHITTLNSVYFEDEKGQNEENPSFDVILSHKDVFVSSGGLITGFTETIKRV